MKHETVAGMITKGVLIFAIATILATGASLGHRLSPDLLIGYGAVGAMLAIAATDYRRGLRKLLGR